MKNSSTLLALLVSASVFAGASAQAAEVDLNITSSTASGSVNNDYTPPFTGQNQSPVGSSEVYGTLGSDDTVTFNYTFTNLQSTPLTPLTTSIGNAGQTPEALAAAFPSTNSTQTVSLDGGLVTVTASMNGLTSAKTTIVNDTGQTINYSSLFEGNFSNFKPGDFTLTFTVGTVPIPGTLLLLGTALAGMVAYGRHKRNAEPNLLAAA